MALTTVAYFDHLKACLNPDFIQDAGDRGSITLKEKIDGVPKPLMVTFPFEGQAFAVNLDLKPKKKGDDPRLFRFLDDEAKPWARKCDFIVFHRMSFGIYAYLIEFKSNNIDQAGIKAQLDAGANWLRSMKRVVEHYFGHTHPLLVQKFVFSTNPNPAAFLDASGEYLRADPSIRFYQYHLVNRKPLSDLVNNMTDEI
jgi:hypothetical protein